MAWVRVSAASLAQLDAAGLAAAAHLHLRLDHHRVADAIGDRDGVIDRGHRLAGRYGDPVAREELLALVLVEIHALLLAVVRPGELVGRVLPR